MLIIFDLDDTLIDTSGSIIPIKLKDALTRMIEEGLAVPSFPEALELLERLNQTAESSRHALSEFLNICDADNQFLEIGLKEIYHNISPEIAISTLPFAPELLAELKENHQLALVTIGFEGQQLAKMKKAGIDSSIFSRIVVTEERNKKPHYQAIISELGFNPHEVIVCGDRVSNDLAPAKELGFTTVHLRWGRGLTSQGLKKDVDYTILQLIDIKKIIHDYK